MKSLLSALVVMFSVQTFAATDSVGVFHSANKVVVLINEQGANSRLQEMMNTLGVGSALKVESLESNIRIQCGRTADEASCTFAFYPSNNVVIVNKSVAATTTLKDLNLTAASPLEIRFESSREDRFVISIDSKNIRLQGSKR